MKAQEGASAPLVRWMGQWVTEAEREAQKVTQPRVELPMVTPERDPEPIRIHPLSRPNPYEWT